MRNAKEVKVVHRWKADDFDGEIPIGGDDEMLGTAMKMANGVGQLSGIVEDSMPAIQTGAWLAFYGGGGLVAGNTLSAYLIDDSALQADVDLKRLGFRAGYLAVSGVGNLLANGMPSGIGEWTRAVGVGTGSAILSARRGVDPRTMKGMKTKMLYAGLASYTVAAISYGWSRSKWGS
jgi:hypothetical protein